MPTESHAHIKCLKHRESPDAASVVHVLLAGDREYAPYLLDFRSNKCLLEFPSGDLIDLTLAALRNASSVKTLLVVGPEILAPRVPKRLDGKPTWFLVQEATFSQNVDAALRWIKRNKPGASAIFLTNDAPLLTSAELNRFASVVLDQRADINVAVSRIETLNDLLVQQYTRSLVGLSDGLYLLANQISISVDAADLVGTLQAVFDLRKQSKFRTKLLTCLFVLKEWRSIRAIATWLRLVLAKRVWLFAQNPKVLSATSVSLQELESSLEALFRHRLHVRINEIPEALGCFDADTPQQLHELRKVIATKLELESKLEASHA